MTTAERNNERATVAEFRAALKAVVSDALAAGIPKYTIRRDIRGALAGLAELPSDDGGVLWCVHVLGPDSVIPQPSFAVANARAELWNADIAEFVRLKPRTAFDPNVHCVAEPWPWSADEHAGGLAEHGGEPTDIT